MSEISISIVGWDHDLRDLSNDLWNTQIIEESAIQLENNTLADLKQFQTLLQELNETVIDYLEATVSDIIKMGEAGGRAVESDEMLGKMWGSE